MLNIHLRVKGPAEDIQGLKEAVAMALEPLGEVRVVSVTVEVPEQIQFEL
ncbi:MAG: hypothetical protein Q4C45_02725 [Oscillospiraceae bacterium]|nr:hypothetical protein [Oscillospiraceae bacterium]